MNDLSTGHTALHTGSGSPPSLGPVKEVQPPMNPTDVKPSPRLVRAAEAECEDLRRQRERFDEARKRTVAALREIEHALAAIDERELLLSRLAPHRADVDVPAAPAVHADATEDVTEPGEILRGPAIREAAVQVLVHRGGIEALHYREWFELLTREGYTVAGKNGLAVFLTQLSRSPVVRKGTQSGVYELDRQAPHRHARELERLQREMRELTGRTRVRPTSPRSAPSASGSPARSVGQSEHLRRHSGYWPSTPKVLVHLYSRYSRRAEPPVTRLLERRDPWRASQCRTAQNRGRPPDEPIVDQAPQRLPIRAFFEVS